MLSFSLRQSLTQLRKEILEEHHKITEVYLKKLDEFASYLSDEDLKIMGSLPRTKEQQDRINYLFEVMKQNLDDPSNIKNVLYSKEEEMKPQEIIELRQEIRQVVKEVLAQPVETQEERTGRLYGLIQEKNLFLPDLPPISEPANRKAEIEAWLRNKSNGSPKIETLSAESVVTVAYFGKMAGINLTLSDGSQVEVKQLVPYSVSGSMWEQLQQPPYRTGDWKRLID